MTKLEQLIKELCPNGVEYVAIKDYFTRLKGTPITAGKMKEIESPDGEIRIFAGGKTVINAHEKDIPNANITRVPAVLVQSRGVIDFIYYEKPFTFKNEMWAYTAENKITVKYLYYFLQNNTQHFRDSASGMGSLPQISLHVTEDFKIPVPPLEVQAEIVKILDNFTELTAELTARKKQYEYYKQQILPLYSQVKTVRLEEISDIIDSLHKTPKYSDFGYSMIRVQDVKNGYIIADDTLKVDKETFDEFVKKYKPQIGDIVVSRVGSYGNFAIINDDNCCLGQNVALIHPRINIKYIFYILNSSYTKSWVQNNVNGASQKSLSIADIKRIPIPVPPIEEQERIVSILDRFDKLCNDISEGLPAEIEARRKQYEYYRDKLLSFEEVRM